tara:strand:- start:539 stop:763 length:225 start_codon:yes stop_codon:yes gene_type:complete
MLVDLSKDEMGLILHLLEEYDLGGDSKFPSMGYDPEYREDIDSLQSKLEPLLDACECQEQKKKKVNLPTPEWEE